ncbi:MAG: type IV secretion system protein, partial [Acidimicrobiia bacterium]
ASGPHGFDNTPRQLMQTAGCDAQAVFNAEATVGRLVGALLYLVVAAAALTLFVVTAFTLVVAKGLALFLISLLPIALYAGLFPGAGRSLLWHWVAALIRVVALVVVMGVFLALLVTGLNGLLSVAGGMWTRFLLVVFFMAVMAVGRRQLLDVSARFADSTLQRLEGTRIGGSHGATWIRPYQAGGLTGLGVTHTIRETTTELPSLPRKKPQPVPAHVEVDSIDDHLAQIGAAGGSTVVPRTVVPGMVVFAQFSDPAGNVVGLVERETPPAG